MPSFKKSVPIPGKSSQELYDIVDSSIDRFLSKTGMGGYELTRDPDAKKLFAKAKLFSATLVCTDGNLSLDVSLSLLAAPFKGQLDSAIEKWVSKNFSA